MSSGLVRDSWRVFLQPSSLQGSTWRLTSFRLPPTMMCRRWQTRPLLPGESPFRVKPFLFPPNWSMLGWGLVVSWSELWQVPLIWFRFGLPIHSGSSSSSHVMAWISILYWWWETYIMRERPLLCQFLNCFGSGSSSSHGWPFFFFHSFPNLQLLLYLPFNRNATTVLWNSCAFQSCTDGACMLDFLQLLIPSRTNPTYSTAQLVSFYGLCRVGTKLCL